MEKYPKGCMWEGVQIEELSHGRLCEIVMQLVSEKEAQRAQEYERMKHALDYLGSLRVVR